MKENVITSILQHDFIFFALSEKIEQSYFCKTLKGFAMCGLCAKCFQPHIAKPVLYEVPTYLGLNFNQINKQKNKKKKAQEKLNKQI